MRSLNFNMLRHDDDIARAFGCFPDILRRLLSVAQDTHYLKMSIPKKNRANCGKYRIVYKVVCLPLQLLQKNIATALTGTCNFPDYVQGFVKGRSIATNAQQHLAKKYLTNVDISNFFESILYVDVVKAFRGVGCNESVAASLATLTTLDRSLPQGASSSPIIANLVCKVMDIELAGLAESYSASYTRYADDITFSGNECPEREEIETILLKKGFVINNKKFKITKRGQNQYVTGLSVFDESCPRVPRKIKRYLRLVLYHAKKYGLENHLKEVLGDEYYYKRLCEKNRIEGWINYICSIEPIVGEKLKEQWRAMK